MMGYELKLVLAASLLSTQHKQEEQTGLNKQNKANIKSKKQTNKTNKQTNKQTNKNKTKQKKKKRKEKKKKQQ